MQIHRQPQLPGVSDESLQHSIDTQMLSRVRRLHRILYTDYCMQKVQNVFPVLGLLDVRTHVL
eukprot:EC726728.1.p4 GENE.EC726728.1~~EC726728.1.p4  ORF type:complete len:63 (-),score=2.49 EC726728.1:394-582(-)